MSERGFEAWAVMNGQPDDAISDPWRMRTRRIRQGGRTLKKVRATHGGHGHAGGRGVGGQTVTSTVGQGSRRMGRSAERVYFEDVVGAIDRRAARALQRHGWEF